MAKSTTKNVSANETFDVEKIKRFTEQELGKLAANSNDLPLCYQIGTDVLVGDYRVVKIDDKTWRVIEKGLSRVGKPIEQIEKSMENTGKLEVYKLEKNLSILTTIAGIAPMLGFLGTIAGMIILFFNVQHQGFDINSIAGGIYTKMVTSATGLIIGLLAYVGYTYLNAQINKQVNRIESASVEFLDFVQDIKQ